METALPSKGNNGKSQTKTSPKNSTVTRKKVEKKLLAKCSQWGTTRNIDSSGGRMEFKNERMAGEKALQKQGHAPGEHYHKPGARKAAGHEKWMKRRTDVSIRA